MSHEVRNWEIPTGLNWNEHSRGSAVTLTGAVRERLLQGRIGEMREALEDHEKGRHGEREAGEDDRLAPDLVGQPAEQDEAGGAEDERSRDQDGGGGAVHLERLGQEEQRVELSRIPDHRLARGRAEQSQDRDLGIRPIAERVGERRLGALALRLHLREHRRFFELHPDPDRHDEQDRRQQERNAPAPIGERLFALPGAQAVYEEQCHEQTDRRGGLNPRGVEAAPALRRMLGDVSRRAAIFPAQRQSLHQAQPDQDDRRGHADARIGRQHADQEGAEAHQRHGDEEGVFAADDVADPAEHQRAERAHRKAGGEGEQGEDEARGRVDAGEELLGQDDPERAVDVEVVPLEHGAERGGEDDEALFAGHPPGALAIHGDRRHELSSLIARCFCQPPAALAGSCTGPRPQAIPPAR